MPQKKKQKSKKQTLPEKFRKTEDRDIRERLQENYPDVELLFMSEPEYDEAIIGVIEGKAHALAVAYDLEKILNILVKCGMSYEEALEYWSYNQVDAYYGEHTWVFVNKGI